MAHRNPDPRAISVTNHPNAARASAWRVATLLIAFLVSAVAMLSPPRQVEPSAQSNGGWSMHSMHWMRTSTRSYVGCSQVVSTA